MKLKIIIVIQSILIIFFITLAIIRTGEAEKATYRAEPLAQEVVKLTAKAENEATKAQAALNDCMSGK